MKEVQFKAGQPVRAFYRGRYRRAYYKWPFDEHKSAVSIFMPEECEIPDRWESQHIPNDLIEPDYLRSFINFITNLFKR